MNEEFRCPSCGYPGLGERPYFSDGGGSYEICPSCGFEFGVTDDDEGYTHETWRAQWIALGMPWYSKSVNRKPDIWDPVAQLENVIER